MIRVVWAIAASNLARWRRSPALVAATLIPAAGMSLTVFALTFAVGRQPVALVRSGYGPLSERVVQILQESDGFFLRERTAEQAAADLRDQWVCAVISIPKNFDEAALAGRGIVEVMINNVDLDFSDDIRRSVSEAVVEIDAPELATLGEEEEPPGAPPAFEEELGPTRNPYKIDILEKNLRKPDVSFLAYQMVPVLALLALTAGALVTALSIAGDREGGRLRVIRVAPASRLAVVLGHLTGGTLSATLLLAVVVVPLALLGVLKAPPGRWPLVAAILLATAVGSTGLGVVVGLVTRRVTTTVLLGVNAASASFLLGGGFTTIAFLPQQIQNIARFTPSYYAVEALREALFYKDIPSVGGHLAVLLATALLSVLLGAAMLSGSGASPSARPPVGRVPTTA